MPWPVVFLAAIISRWHGGGFFKSPKTLKNLAWGFVCASPVAYAYYQSGFTPLLTIVVFILVLIGCAIGKATGHGGGMDLSHNPKEPGAGRELERVESLIFWAYSYLPRRVYDGLILMLTGVAAVLAGVVALAFVSPIGACILLYCGAAKWLAYEIGWRLYPEGNSEGPWQDVDEPTEIGELLTGLFVGLGLATVIFTF